MLPSDCILLPLGGLRTWESGVQEARRKGFPDIILCSLSQHRSPQTPPQSQHHSEDGAFQERSKADPS